MGSVFDRLAGTKVGSRPVDGGHVGIDGGDAFEGGGNRNDECSFRRLLASTAATRTVEERAERNCRPCSGGGLNPGTTGFCTEFSVTGCEKELLWLAAVVSLRVVVGGGEALRDGLIGVGEVGDEDQKQGGSAIREQ
ncbi:MAG: hypothetical protein ACI9PP_000552 [Halobacteriales archaeon]|jgi:hypothetical protein